MVAVGESVQVTATATDNTGVSSVTADGTPMAKAGADTWTATLAADAAFGAHNVSVVAKDAAGTLQLQQAHTRLHV
jgi:predicted aminopeptidase